MGQPKLYKGDLEIIMIRDTLKSLIKPVFLGIASSLGTIILFVSQAESFFVPAVVAFIIGTFLGFLICLPTEQTQTGSK
jgi:hypothetical protein